MAIGIWFAPASQLKPTRSKIYCTKKAQLFKVGLFLYQYFVLLLYFASSRNVKIKLPELASVM